MASPQSSVDMDISDGSDLDRASHSSDMDVSNNSEDEISQNTSNIALNNNINDVSLAQQMRIPPSNNYYYKPPPSYPRVYEVTNQSTNSLYTQGLPIVPPNAESYYATQAPVVTEGYQYFNYQQPANLSTSTLHNHQQPSMYHNSNQPSLSMDLTVGTSSHPITLDDVDHAPIGDQGKKRQAGSIDNDDDDSDSLSSYVTAPLYTVNESEEEGLIGDEDEDDMETLGWYKHNVQKLDTEIDKTRKSKRALEEELLRLQIKLSVEKNKMNSIMKKNNEKKKKKKKVIANIDKGKKRMDMESLDSTSFVPEDQQKPSVLKSMSSTPPTPDASLPASSCKSTSSTVAQKQAAQQSPTSAPITSNLPPLSSTLQKPVEKMTINATVPKVASSVTNAVSQPSLPLPSASGTVMTNKSIKTKGPHSSVTAPVSSPMVQKSTVSATPSKSSTVSTSPSTTSESIPSKVSSSITPSTSQKVPSFSSPKTLNKPNPFTNVNKKPPVSSNNTPPTRVNAITQKNSSSINPAPKNVIQHQSKGAFKPYESPLRRFGFSHMDTNGNGVNNDNNMMSSGIIISSNGVGNNSSNNNVDNGNSEDMNRELCRYETVGGTCNDDTCQALHFRDFQ